jgi:hypothetical protein
MTPIAGPLRPITATVPVLAAHRPLSATLPATPLRLAARAPRIAKPR